MSSPEMLALADEIQQSSVRLLADTDRFLSDEEQAAVVSALRASAGGRPDREGPSEIQFGYVNWRGEKALRRATPISVQFHSSDWHKEPQWLMLAIDAEKNEPREFAMRDMTNVVPDATLSLHPVGPDTNKSVQRAMDLLGDVPGDTIEARVERIVSWYLGLQTQIEELKARPLTPDASAGADESKCLGRSVNEPCAPDDKYKRCQICGFVIDASFEAEKPAISYSPASKGRTHPAPAEGLREASSSIEYQQKRGVAWDIVDEALLAYNDYMLDADYDAQQTLDKIMQRMDTRRAFYNDGKSVLSALPHQSTGERS